MKSENKPVGSANVVATSDDEPDGCWSAVFVSKVSELGVDIPSSGGKEMEWSARQSGHGLTAALVTQVKEARTSCIELYNSGATCHISPYHDDFFTYQTLNLPHYLNVTNSQQFPALGTEDMVISAPNSRGGQTELTLKNVLHTLSVGYTLVSLGALDKLGHRISIGDEHLNIQSCTDDCIIHIAQTMNGLYCVSHEKKGGYAVKVVSIMELH